MNLDLIRKTIPLDSWRDDGALLEDSTTVFWVDWREEDDAIVGYCEDILSTGRLSAEAVETDTKEGFNLYVLYGDRRLRVPLTYSEKDRHVTLLTLNKALAGEYEVRLCTASDGSDTLAFVPLQCAQWAELESEFGARVARHFHVITETPNVFTDPLPYARQRIATLKKPWWKLW